MKVLCGGVVGVERLCGGVVGVKVLCERCCCNRVCFAKLLRR